MKQEEIWTRRRLREALALLSHEMQTGTITAALSPRAHRLARLLAAPPGTCPSGLGDILSTAPWVYSAGSSRDIALLVGAARFSRLIGQSVDGEKLRKLARLIGPQRLQAILEDGPKPPAPYADFSNESVLATTGTAIMNRLMRKGGETTSLHPADEDAHTLAETDAYACLKLALSLRPIATSKASAPA